MRKRNLILLVFVFIITTDSIQGQKQKSYNELIKETNKFLKHYSQLNPFIEYQSLKDLALSKKEFMNLLTDLNNYDVALNDSKDLIESHYLIDYFQDKILNNIEQLTAHRKFKKRKLKRLTPTSELDIIESDDKKLYNFSLDEKTGGTYRSRISVMHYTEISPRHSLNDKKGTLTEKKNPYEIFTGDGFDNIYSIETDEGIKYILTGSVRGCSYCFESSIMLVKFENNVFKKEFFYAVNSRSWEGGINYNKKTKVITVDYVTDDLTSTCDCTNDDTLDENQNYSSTKEDQQIKQNCHCTFKFNGLTFELVEKSINT